MPTVVFTDNLKRHIDCSEIDVAGETVRQALDAVFTNYKQLRGYIVDDQARLRKHMVVFIDGCGLVAVRTRPVSTRSWCIPKTATISPSAFRVVARGCPKTVAILGNRSRPICRKSIVRDSLRRTGFQPVQTNGRFWTG